MLFVCIQLALVSSVFKDVLDFLCSMLELSEIMQDQILQLLLVLLSAGISFIPLCPISTACLVLLASLWYIVLKLVSCLTREILLPKRETQLELERAESLFTCEYMSLFTCEYMRLNFKMIFIFLSKFSLSHYKICDSRVFLLSDVFLVHFCSKESVWRPSTIF